MGSIWELGSICTVCLSVEPLYLSVFYICFWRNGKSFAIDRSYFDSVSLSLSLSLSLCMQLGLHELISMVDWLVGPVIRASPTPFYSIKLLRISWYVTFRMLFILSDSAFVNFENIRSTLKPRIKTSILELDSAIEKNKSFILRKSKKITETRFWSCWQLTEGM